MLTISGTISGIDYYIEIKNEARELPHYKQKIVNFTGSDGTIGYTKHFPAKKQIPTHLILTETEKTTLETLLTADSVNCPGKLTFTFTANGLQGAETLTGYIELADFEQWGNSYNYIVNIIEV